MSHIPEMHSQLDKAWSEQRMVRSKAGRNVKSENCISVVTGAVRLRLLADLCSSSGATEAFDMANKSGNNYSDGIYRPNVLFSILHTSLVQIYIYCRY
jgi:hypothetical protein